MREGGDRIKRQGREWERREMWYRDGGWKNWQWKWKRERRGKRSEWQGVSVTHPSCSINLIHVLLYPIFPLTVLSLSPSLSLSSVSPSNCTHALPALFLHQILPLLSFLTFFSVLSFILYCPLPPNSWEVQQVTVHETVRISDRHCMCMMCTN